MVIAVFSKGSLVLTRATKRIKHANAQTPRSALSDLGCHERLVFCRVVWGLGWSSDWGVRV